MLEDRNEFKWWLLREVSTEEEADEALYLAVELVWMKASHDTEANHMGVDDILLHFLTLGQFRLAVDLELCVFGDALDDSQSDSLIFVNVVLL